jgi:uncharacterized membrane protein YphA (DoxX/SURF4 family)
MRIDTSTFATLLGRAFISIIFIASGLSGSSRLGWIELYGGFLLLIGFQTRVSAALLALYLLPVLLIIPVHFQTEAWLKNVAVLGALLGVIATGGGPLSVDRYLKREKKLLIRM